MLFNILIPSLPGNPMLPSDDSPPDKELSYFEFIVIVIFMVLPWAISYPNLISALRKQVHVSNIEMMRNMKYVQKVKMAQKTKKIVRILAIINRLRNQAKLAQIALDSSAMQHQNEAQRPRINSSD